MLGSLVRAAGIGRRLTMEKFVARADQAERLVATLRERLDTLRGLVEQEEIQRLTVENADLLKQVRTLLTLKVVGAVACSKCSRFD